MSATDTFQEPLGSAMLLAMDLASVLTLRLLFRVFTKTACLGETLAPSSGLSPMRGELYSVPILPELNPLGEASVELSFGRLFKSIGLGER